MSGEHSASEDQRDLDRDQVAMLADHGIELVRAPNPGPMTLDGTNTWIVGRDPAWVIDPGPAIPGHVRSVVQAVQARGGLGGVALTHDHDDHSGGVRALLEELPAKLAAGRGAVDVLLADDLMVGPLRALASPGHAPDHFALVAGRVCFCGDAVLGEGSVFITPHPGALAGYLSALERLRSLELDVLCPGHGPPIWEPAVKLGEYIEHRRERERALLEALAQGWRSSEELLDWAWADVPVHMRPLAVVTLAAHLDKLAEEDRLPAGVPRPKPPPWLSGLEP